MIVGQDGAAKLNRCWSGGVERCEGVVERETVRVFQRLRRMRALVPQSTPVGIAE